MVGVCFQGGGSRASFSSGCILALDKAGIKPDLVAGTSGGALVASLYTHIGAANTVHEFSNITDISQIFEHNSILGDALNFNAGFYNHDPLKLKLQNLIANVVPSIQTIVTHVDLDTEDLIFHWSGTTHPHGLLFYESVCASCCIPVVVAPYNNRFVDGGTEDNLPLQVLVDAGCSEIYAILTRPSPFKQDDWTLHGYKLYQIAMRAIDALTYRLFLDDLAVKKNHPEIKWHVLAPGYVLDDPMNFNQQIMQAQINHGADITSEYLKTIIL